MPSLRVEVVHALARSQKVVTLSVPPGTTAQEAVALSGLPWPAHGGVLGLFGRRIPLSQILQDGDRVEILRPLAADPKEARRRRAQRRSATRV